MLIKIDNTEIKNHKQFTAYLESLTPGSTVNLTIKRGGQNLIIPVACAVSADDGKNKLGLWIRDSTKGIGTITYYNPANSRFAALGHGVVDVDTKQLIPVKDGRLYQTEVVAVKKGKNGNPGELVGEVDRYSAIGVITENTAVGLYGTVNIGNKQLPAAPMRIALQGDVHEGPAVILSNVNGHEIKQYDIYIERVNRYAADESKGMVIRITDQELITRTNGIVQGMSGCPIIQNGRLIGAVTHVFVQNPLKGYGIFIENMMKQERKL
jgi:stage IV sporulation protein B